MSNTAFEEIHDQGHRWQIVKVDSAREIQGYIENIGIDFQLLGYTIGADPSYFASAQIVGAIAEIRVSTGNDDAEECLPAPGTVDRADGEFNFVGNGSDCGGNDQELGMRFQNISPVFKGMTVTNAFIEFTAKNSDSGSTNLTFYGEATDDAAGHWSSVIAS